ncbi:allantoate amidohydrolase, partial [Alcaligenes faecalis subsp. faecalis NCIB 8687]
TPMINVAALVGHANLRMAVMQVLIATIGAGTWHWGLIAAVMTLQIVLEAILPMEHGADVVVLGCAGMASQREALEQALGIAVVEPTQATVAVALGLDAAQVSLAKPTDCTPDVMSIIEQAASALGYPSMVMPSGPIGMIFIPCLNGRSHCPEESITSSKSLRVSVCDTMVCSSARAPKRRRHSAALRRMDSSFSVSSE